MRWEARAFNEVVATSGQTSLFLRDALPRFLKSLVTLLSENQRAAAQIDFDAAELYRLSKEHGRGRAGVPAYIISQVIYEYHILREVILQVMEQNSPLEGVDREIIYNAFEQAVNVAATEFTLALKEVQDRFLVSLAHDLKTPVTAAQLLAELIQKTPKAENVPVLANRLILDMKRMTEMVENILDTGRVSAGETLNFPLSTCDLGRVADEVVSSFNLAHGECIVLTSTTLPVIGMWNQEYLRRMIENLVNNAFKFRSFNSTITVSVRQTDESATLVVHNEGEPISIEERQKLFKPFARGAFAVNQKGWGLGLILVKGVVDTLNGLVRVDSTEQGGTSFIVELPKKVGRFLRKSGPVAA